MAKKPGKKGGHRVKKRADNSEATCKKVANDCGMSTSICDETRLKTALKHEKMNQQQEVAHARERVKGAIRDIADFRKERAKAVIACRKNAKAAEHAATFTHPESSSYMNRYGRFGRRSRR